MCTCEACGRVLITPFSGKPGAPRVMTDADDYWRLQVDARCAPPLNTKPGPILDKGGKY